MALAPATLELAGQWEKCPLNAHTHTCLFKDSCNRCSEGCGEKLDRGPDVPWHWSFREGGAIGKLP